MKIRDMSLVFSRPRRNWQNFSTLSVLFFFKLNGVESTTLLLVAESIIKLA